MVAPSSGCAPAGSTWTVYRRDYRTALTPVMPNDVTSGRVRRPEIAIVAVPPTSQADASALSASDIKTPRCCQ